MIYNEYQTKVARHIIESGTLLYHKNRSNEYVGVDEYLVEKCGHNYLIEYVDGMLAEMVMMK